MNENTANNIKVTAQNIKSIIDDYGFNIEDKKELILKALDIIQKDLDEL